ncbi:unnamed protein product, partial [Amoebophrya sp. A120]|eukprot:GSA120T00012130001.1
MAWGNVQQQQTFSEYCAAKNVDKSSKLAMEAAAVAYEGPDIYAHTFQCEGMRHMEWSTGYVISGRRY